MISYKLLRITVFALLTIMVLILLGLLLGGGWFGDRTREPLNQGLALSVLAYQGSPISVAYSREVRHCFAKSKLLKVECGVVKWYGATGRLHLGLYVGKSDRMTKS